MQSPDTADLISCLDMQIANGALNRTVGTDLSEVLLLLCDFTRGFFVRTPLSSLI